MVLLRSRRVSHNRCLQLKRVQNVGATGSLVACRREPAGLQPRDRRGEEPATAERALNPWCVNLPHLARLAVKPYVLGLFFTNAGRPYAGFSPDDPLPRHPHWGAAFACQ